MDWSFMSGISSGMSVTVQLRTNGENKTERRPVPDSQTCRGPSFLFELLLLPESVPGTSVSEKSALSGKFSFNFPLNPTYTISRDLFLSTRKTLAIVKYPSMWFAGLAFALPHGCLSFLVRSYIYIS